MAEQPVPGGELIRISVLSASIRDLPGHAERLPPHELAGALAHYLTAMAHVIQQECRGTLEQAQGDSLRARGEFEIKRGDFKVPATSAFHGTVRVRDRLKVMFDIVARRS